MEVGIDVITLIFSGAVLGFIIIATIVSIEEDKPKIIIYLLAMLFGAISSYLVLKSIISLFWRVVDGLPIIKLISAKIALFILSDPLAFWVFIATVLVGLGFLEKETSVIYVLLNNAHYHYQHWLSVRLRRLKYSIFRGQVKNGTINSFEDEARRVVK